MSKFYSVKPEWAKNSWLDSEKYQQMYQQSVEDPEGFWAQQAERLYWYRKWDKVLEHNFAQGEHAWFINGKTNAAYNCLDRHLEKHADQIAFYWEGDNPEETKVISYRQLYEQVCRFANVLKVNGVRKGDRVTLYLPMILELPIAMLACARIGAIHSVVFGGFSPDSIHDRILNCHSTLVVTADGGYRSGKLVPLKVNTDEALAKGDHSVSKVIVVKRAGNDVDWQKNRDVWWHDEMAEASADCPCEEMDAEDPLFILYTSGSTGKPKGVMHTTGGFLTYTAMSHQYVFDYHDGDIYWCTADIGWITGHSYIVYGPLCNGATCVLFEGVPSYPDYRRFWQVVDKYKVTIFYTAPTALRAIMREGNDCVKATRRESLRLLGSVGEPINPEVWEWYYHVVGDGRCLIVDTWWQTETGGICISPLPGVNPLKPGWATKPFFGIQPILVDDKGNLIEGPGRGNLCIKFPWPGLMRGVFGEPERFKFTYFTTYAPYYFTGDGARRDEDNDYLITGRVDDVINVSGHRLGTAELESALVKNAKVAEAAVVGYPHDIKGQGIYAYITLQTGEEPGAELEKELKQWIRHEIGPIAIPDIIHWAPRLPKTRSGKIMRRILRKIASNEFDALGDLSTLAEPDVVNALIQTKPV
ncbi:MAG: acetate--CoA ligase [Desulfobacterales bacterium]|nr:acetate--CoA ligase [Desulfobacterales bacterium]